MAGSRDRVSGAVDDPLLSFPDFPRPFVPAKVVARTCESNVAVVDSGGGALSVYASNREQQGLLFGKRRTV